MVNFRFHLVSLTAVFLALAAGIAIGASVVDRQTVDILNAQLKRVENNRQETNAQNDELRSQLSQWDKFAAESGERLVEGRLPDLPVLVVGVKGTDRKPVDALTVSLQAAGARNEGELWFTKKWALTDAGDVQQLTQLIGAAPGTKPADLRAQTISRLFETWSAGNPGLLLVPLRDAAFVEYQPPRSTEKALETVSLTGSEAVVVASDQGDVPPVDVALPIVAALADQQVPVVAASPVGAKDRKPTDPVPLALLVRNDNDVSARVSSVDNIDEYKGRVAAVLALGELRSARRGHYGIDASAQRVLPEPAPQ